MSGGPARAEAPPRALVLIGGSERFHDLIAGGRALVETLITNGIPATLSQDASILRDHRKDLYEVVLLYSQTKILDTAEQEALDAFIAGGGGFVPLHAANVMGMPDHQRYEALVGSTFTGHDRFGRFTVDIVGEHPVTAGVGGFAIDDELYRIAWNGPAGQVLATATSAETPMAPTVYVKAHGSGRICYIALGHDGRAWWHPSFRRLVAQATRWAAGERDRASVINAASVAAGRA